MPRELPTHEGGGGVEAQATPGLMLSRESRDGEMPPCLATADVVYASPNFRVTERAPSKRGVVEIRQFW